jgi:hypothetical protein
VKVGGEEIIGKVNGADRTGAGMRVGEPVMKAIVAPDCVGEGTLNGIIAKEGRAVEGLKQKK